MRRAAAALVVAGLLSCESSTAPDVVAVIEVTPFNTNLLVGPGGGQTQQLTAVAKRSNGSVISGSTFTWVNGSPSVISVSPTGLVTALAPGLGIVGASVGEIEGEAIVNVASVPVASFRIADDSAFLVVSSAGVGVHQVVGVMRDSAGNVITDRPLFWGSTANGVATVNSNGLVRAVGPGVARIIGGREGRTDTLLVGVSVTAPDDLPDDVDIDVVSAHWTQGMQAPDGSIPMIRGGRAAVVNVLLSATRSTAVPSTYRLTVREAGGAEAWSASRTLIVPTGAPATSFAPSLQFLVPNDVLQAGRTWEVVRDPDAVLPDAAAANDRFPRVAPAAIAMVDVPTLRVRLVPVQLLSHGGVTPNVTTGDIEDYIRTVRQLHPHGPIEVTIGPAHATAASFGVTPAGGAVAFWIQLLGELDVERLADTAFDDAHWIGIVAPPAGFTSTAFGGFGYIPTDGASFAAQTRTSTLIRLGWFTREAQTRELVAHELGHNFGRRHAPCGAAGNPDPSYPIAGGRIGPGGHDVFSWSESAITSAPGIPETVGDLMGYCTPPWIGRYTYEGVLQFRGFEGTVAMRAAPPPRGRALLVRGRIANGVVTLAPPVTLATRDRAEAPDGEVLVEGRDASGRLLFTRRARLGRFDHDEGTRPFAVAIPLDAGLEAALTELRAVAPTGSARLSVR